MVHGKFCENSNMEGPEKLGYLGNIEATEFIFEVKIDL